MIKKVLFLLFFLISWQAQATHIVGGEFEMKHVTGNFYEVALNMYFDDVNGSPGALDASIKVSIFSKRNNTRMGDYDLGRVSMTFVPYTNMDCAIGTLRTRRILYTQTIELNPSSFTDSLGYYVVWERCCRNNTIDNIISPGAAGQTFYLEFPALVKNGQPFINSSPTLFPPLSDYACVNQLFYFDFSGSDVDNDSLIYEMVTPLNGHSSSSIPQPTVASPGPYPLINWQTGLGFGPNAQITGTPPININRTTGLLTLQPNRQGLFVFGIKCIEFRDGVKIGEVRRDFQLLVISCPTNDKPDIQVQLPGTKTFYNQQDTIRISATGNRCLDVKLTDTDPNEALTFSLKPINFTSPLPVLSNTQGIVNTGSSRDSITATICFPGCFSTNGQTYLMDLVVADDGCSLPKRDTIRFKVIVEPQPDQAPVIAINPGTTTYRPSVGQTLQFTVTGQDADNDQVTIEAFPKNFLPGPLPYQFNLATGTGSVSSLFNWKIACDAIRNAVYEVDFVVSSTACGITKKDTISVQIDPVYGNTPPVLTADRTDLDLTLPYNTPFRMDLLGLDIDPNRLTLTATGDGFNLADYGMNLTTIVIEQDTGRIVGEFTWTPTCEAVKAGTLKINFDLTEETCQPEPQRLTLLLRVPNPDTIAFIPPNIFTPNNDGINDFFGMPTLPPDFCDEVFSNIKIFNRWGNQVFKSNDRNFEWSGKNASAGDYFYLIKFREKTYKGTVTIVK